MKSCPWTQLQSHRLESPPNIFSSSTFSVDGADVYLVASAATVHCLVPGRAWARVKFTDLPDDASIVSLTCLNAHRHKSRMHVVSTAMFAVTFGKPDMHAISPSGQKWYMNVFQVYLNREKELCVEDFQSMELSFTPFLLSASDSLVPGGAKTYILLSGSDNHLHLYKQTAHGKFFEISSNRGGFPLSEFRNLSSIVVSISTKFWDISPPTRIVAVGCQDGLVKVSICSLETRESPTARKVFSRYIDGPVSSMEVFCPTNPRALRDSRHVLLTNSILSKESISAHIADPESPTTSAPAPIDLVVGSAIGTCSLFRDIATRG
eukprot:719_1